MDRGDVRKRAGGRWIMPWESAEWGVDLEWDWDHFTIVHHRPADGSPPDDMSWVPGTRWIGDWRSLDGTQWATPGFDAWAREHTCTDSACRWCVREEVR